MPYLLHEIEITQPLPTLTLSEAQTGIGLIVRRRDRAIGFLMQSLAPNSVILPDTIAEWIAAEVGEKILQESIGDELSLDTKPETLPTLTVVICTKDRPEDLARCLQHLLALQGDPAAFELLVVDNAPSDQRTETLVASLPTVHYVQEPKPGLDFARNRALQTVQTEMLAFIDDDVAVDRGWLAGLRSAIAQYPEAAAFTGLVLPYELATDAQVLFEQAGGFRRGFDRIYYGQSEPDNPFYPCGSGIFGAGCNMAFRRDALLQLGGFDDALDTGAPLPGGGDLDIFYRVVRAGYPLVYEPRYLVFHRHRREYEKLRRQYWSWGLGFMAFVVKSCQTDPALRPRFYSLIRWWFKDQFRQLRKSFSHDRRVLPPAMVVAQLWGGIEGLMGGYGRSRNRIQQIRRQFS
ncbi:glycosyltransferase [Cyanobacteria bacterium FACHB-DQ100]|uniref:glycosyltransferase family 2 protein n=1 Tax=Leptolyngbya sp. DQ-M1 TaxID=2933920 RepID=UPI0019C232EA|nr:glycosyltransferase [Cyanobacteria bacterium FACHB-DQ100]